MSEELAQRMLRLTNANSPRWLLCALHYMIGQACQSRSKLEKASEHLELANSYLGNSARTIRAGLRSYRPRLRRTLFCNSDFPIAHAGSSRMR